MTVNNSSGTMKVSLDEKSLLFSVSAEGELWKWKESYRPHFLSEEETVYFSQAEKIVHQEISNGVGKGILSTYSGFIIAGEKRDLVFETLVWVEEATEDVYF